MKAQKIKPMPLPTEDQFFGLEESLQRELFRSMCSAIRALEQRLDKVEASLHQDSSNSSKPPSSDGYTKPAPRNLRGKSDKKPGAQKGHKGMGYSLPKTPDKVIACMPSNCQGCPFHDQCQSTARVGQRRYVTDVEVQVQVTEFDQMEVSCPFHQETFWGSFPEGVTGPVQYGNKLSALASLLFLHGVVSYERIHDILKSLTDLPLSRGWVFDKIKKLANSADLSETLEKIRSLLLKAKVINADETGLRVNGKLAWCHSASNSRYTYQTISPKRGSAGMIAGGFLNEYRGIIVHDFFRSYWKFTQLSGHGTCGVHLMREMKGIGETWENQKWSIEMFALFSNMNDFRNQAIENGQRRFYQPTIDMFTSQYNEILLKAREENPIPTEQEPVPGRKKSMPLITRLDKHQDEVLLFLKDFDVPFTNNQAERDIRSVKVRMKVSGCFRKWEGSEGYLRLRSYVSTAGKHGVGAFKAICLALSGQSGEVLVTD